ncbi:hypothetical protein ACGTN9_11900, partial [Halobacillus sp. MO56]
MEVQEITRFPWAYGELPRAKALRDLTMYYAPIGVSQFPHNRQANNECCEKRVMTDLFFNIFPTITLTFTIQIHQSKNT